MDSLVYIRSKQNLDKRPNGLRGSKACGGAMLPQNIIIMYTVHHAVTNYLKMNRPMSLIC